MFSRSIYPVSRMCWTIHWLSLYYLTSLKYCHMESCLFWLDITEYFQILLFLKIDSPTKFDLVLFFSKLNKFSKYYDVRAIWRPRIIVEPFDISTPEKMQKAWIDKFSNETQAQTLVFWKQIILTLRCQNIGIQECPAVREKFSDTILSWCLRICI